MFVRSITVGDRDAAAANIVNPFAGFEGPHPVASELPDCGVRPL